MNKPKATTDRQTIVTQLREVERHYGQDPTWSAVAAGLTERVMAQQPTQKDLELLGKIQRGYERSGQLEANPWIGTVITVLTRQRVQETASPQAPSAPPGVDVTLAHVPQSLQAAKLDLLRKDLMPYARDHAERPKECVDGLKQILARGTNVELVPLMIDLSGQGRLLNHPLYLVGQALLGLFEDGNVYVRQWFGQQSTRLTWLREGVQHFSAEHAKDRIVDLIGDFQGKYLGLPDHYRPHATSQLAISLQPYLRSHPNACRGLAQMLLSAMELSPAQEAIGRVLIEQARPLVQERRLSPYATAALSGLLKKLKRIAKARKAAEAQATQETDYEAADADLSAARSDAQATVRQVQKASQPQAAQGILSTATSYLQDEVMGKDPQGFIDRYLKPALQQQGHDLGIDVANSSFQLLGAGCTSIVVEVQDRLSGKPVAMRCDKQGLGDEESGKIAMRGVALQSRLTHPNIAQSLGFDTIRIPVQVSKRTVQVTMMYQQLENLRTSVGLDVVLRELHQRGQAPHPEAVRAFGYQVFSALEYCHDMGIVHRDLKPENIMVTPPANWKPGDIHDLLKRGTPKIVDFGSARDVNEAEGGATITKGFAGTAPYLAPAVLGYPAQNRDPAEGDMYPMGIILYELLSGQNETHPVKHSHSHAANFERNVKPASAQQITYSSTIGVIQPGDAPIVSHTDPLLERFQGQQGATATLTGKQVKMMAENIVAQAERLSDPDPKKRPTAEDMVAFFENPIDSAFVRFETKTPPREQRSLKKTGRRAAAREEAHVEAPSSGIMATLKKLRNMLPF